MHPYIYGYIYIWIYTEEKYSFLTHIYSPKIEQPQKIYVDSYTMSDGTRSAQAETRGAQRPRPKHMSDTM